jgi:hypothetical protein
MRLAELDPHFLVLAPPGAEYSYRQTDDLAEAQGIMFACPTCFAKNGGLVGTHQIICWSRSRGVPDDQSPMPGRWTLEGTGYTDLTLNGDPPGAARSVLLTGGCRAHFHVTSGEVA